MNNEVSTRNCYNAKVKGKEVYCSKGHWRKTHTWGYISWGKVGKLAKECIDCADYDDSWDEK